MRPPSSAVTSLAMDSPSPVPPYRRLSVPSPCWKAPKITARFSGAMPIPVSVTENASRLPSPSPAPSPAAASTEPGSAAAAAAETARTRSVTCPFSVNLTAFDSRLPSTWRSRCRSVTSSAGADGSIEISKSSPFSAVSGPNVACRSSTSALSRNRSACTSIRPASTLDRSRMSLMSCSRSEPAEWMTFAYSTCLAVRFRPGFCASSRARISRLFSGVRSSCDMFARNCDLYWEARPSCLARSSISSRAREISAFFASMSCFWAASSAAFSSRSALDSAVPPNATAAPTTAPAAPRSAAATARAACPSARWR